MYEAEKQILCLTLATSAGVKLYSVWEMIAEFSLLSQKLFIL